MSKKPEKHSDTVRRVFGDPEGPMVYMNGGPKAVAAMIEALLHLPPKEDIRITAGLDENDEAHFVVSVGETRTCMSIDETGDLITRLFFLISNLTEMVAKFDGSVSEVDIATLRTMQ